MKIFNKILMLLSLFFVVLFSSCSWGNKENVLTPPLSNKEGVASLTINLGGKCAARRIDTPSFDFSKYTFVLEGKTTDESKSFHEDFSYGSEKKFYVYFGKWNFTLNAYKTGDENKTPVLKGSLNDFTVNEETTKLSFNMEYGDAKGSLKYSVKYPSDEYTVLSAEVYNKAEGYINLVGEPLYVFYFYENEEMLEKFFIEDGVPNEILPVLREEGNPDVTAIIELSDYLPAENYTLYLKVENYVLNPYTDELEGPLTTSKYEAKVPVIPGEVTNGSYEFTDINRRFLITYDVDESLGFEYNPELYSSTFIKYHRIYIPAVDSLAFGGWYYEKGTEKVELPLIEEGDYEGFYLLNEDYLLSENVELKAKVLKGNGEINIFDPSTISINGPDVLEIDEIDIKYSTIQIKNANYVWYWDGEEVENEFGHTCVINTSKLSSVDAGIHTLKVEIDYNRVWADASFEVSIVPRLTVFYNQYSTAIAKPWVVRPLADDNGKTFNRLGEVVGKSSLDAFCFDNGNSFYAAEYNGQGEDNYYIYNIKKYAMNPRTCFYDSGIEPYSVSIRTEKNRSIHRMTSDGQNIYYVAISNSGYGINFTDEYDSGNLYMTSLNNGNTVNIDVSSDFTVTTAVSYENGYLYVAGYLSNQKEKTDRIYYEENDYEDIDVYDNLYQILKYPVVDGNVNISDKSVVYYYEDHDVWGENPLQDSVVSEENPSIIGTLGVSNIITDLIVKNNCIYALRCEAYKMLSGSFGNDYRFSTIYKDLNVENPVEVALTRVLNKTIQNKDFVEGPYPDDTTKEYIYPVRILAVRRKELDFGFYSNNDTPRVCTVDLMDKEALLKYSGVEYGYSFRFDNNIVGTGVLIEYHNYQAGEAEYISQE